MHASFPELMDPMAIAKRPAPRKRPQARTAATAPSAPDAAVADEKAKKTPGATQAKDATQAAEALVADFESSLKSQHNLSDEERNFLASNFKQAVSSAAADGRDVASLALPDTSQWFDIVASLRDAGAIDEKEATELTRTLNEALKPFEKRETKLALEFSKRLQAEGEASALAWLRAQRDEETEADAGSQPPGQERPASLPTDAVRSRSRRVRGPPKK